MKIIKPGKMIKRYYAADNKREEFDVKNESILSENIQTDVCFIGDSITEAWEVSAYFSRFGYLVNRGISGDVPEGLLFRFDADVVQLKPKICVAMAGINTSWRYQKEIQNGWNSIRRVQIKDAIKIASIFREMCKKCQKAGIVFFICSVLPMEFLPNCRDYRNEYVREINKNLKKVAAEFKFPYIDYYQNLIDEEGKLVKGLSEDGLHPNLCGYDIMAKTLTPYLEDVLNK